MSNCIHEGVKLFKLYSKGCEYAVRALVYVAEEDEDGQARVKIAEICKRAEIPEAYTRKVFQALVRGEFLTAHRGPGGGYSLTRPSSEISILDVIVAVDGENTFGRCVMGLSGCGGDKPCPLHHIWAGSKERMLHKLRSCTLREIKEMIVARRKLLKRKKKD